MGGSKLALVGVCVRVRVRVRVRLRVRVRGGGLPPPPLASTLFVADFAAFYGTKIEPFSTQTKNIGTGRETS
jgi:hypothetical protein